jgi:hypothetical protein
MLRQLRRNHRLFQIGVERIENFVRDNPVRAAKKSRAQRDELRSWRDLNFCVLNSNQQRREGRGCRSVELRALCNEVPRTPPGPEGSNGIGIASGAADHPKFLASKSSSQPTLRLRSEPAVESRK